MSKSRRIAVTGADGYIGRRVIAHLPADEAVRLSRRRPRDTSLAWAAFDIADAAPTLPPDVGAVIHLAADVTFSLTADQELANLRGLIAAAKTNGATFVLVSSQSAKSPRSEYGQRKAAAEAVVREAGGVIVRPGLVIGGRKPKGLAAQIISLSRFPILPDFGRTAQVQVVHVEDLAEALISIARGPTDRILELAGPLMTLRQLITVFAFRLRGRAPTFVPVPVVLTRMVAGKARRGPRASLRQMLDLQVLQDTEGVLDLSRQDASLAALASNRPLRRALIIEGRVLLRAVGFKRPTSTMMRRYVRIIERDVFTRAIDLAPLDKLGSAAVASRIDRTDLREHRRRLLLAFSLFECSPEGASAVMRLAHSSWLSTTLGLVMLGPAVIVDVLRARFVSRLSRSP